jgi:hypothetical protein
MLTLEKALNLAESALISDYPFSTDRCKLTFSERLVILWEFLLRRFYGSDAGGSYEITAQIDYEADKRMLIPLLMHILLRPDFKDYGVRVNLVLNTPLSQDILDQLRSCGCNVVTNNFSLITACARPSRKIVILCLDHRFFYEYHKPGVDTADILRKFSVKTVSIQHGGSREDSVRGLASSASDIVLVWGRRVFRDLVQTYGVDQRKLRLVGNPLHDGILSLDRRTVISKMEGRYPGFQQALLTKKLVLLATILHYEYMEFKNEQEMYVQYVNQVYDSLDPSRMMLIVKMHPTDIIDPNLYLQLIPPHLAGSVIVVEPGVTGLDVYSLVHISDLLITRASTVAEEALVMGKQVIAFDLIEAGPSKGYKHLEKYKMYRTVYATSKSVLRDAIYTALFSDCNFIRRESAIEDEFTYSLDGNSTDRAARQIIHELFQSAPGSGDLLCRMGLAGRW